MIARIEALRFRCLRFVTQSLESFHVLVGPNASGKTTFLDVVAFLGDLLNEPLEQVIGERSGQFEDLIWRREGGSLQVAIEADVPSHLMAQSERSYQRIRYEVSVGQEEGEGPTIQEERVLLHVRPRHDPTPKQQPLFPLPKRPRQSIMSPRTQRHTRTIVKKSAAGNDNFYDETEKGWDHAFKLGPRRSALANLPEDESKFPISTWLKTLLSQGVNKIVLNSLALRKASPPVRRSGFETDGSNLPWVIHQLEEEGVGRLSDWVDHIRTALPDILGIRTIERPDDRHRYLMIKYRGGFEIPSWLVSDGTLRLLALTIPAYLPDFEGIYLIEEPENGIHPRAVETVFRSLSSVYGAQILLASHSPVMLGIADAENVLCFAKDSEGATDIIRGDRHPALIDWKGEASLGTLFAAGVLGTNA